MVRVEYRPSPAGARLLADGDEILFADLRCGLDIVCDWLPDGRSVNGATCQVFVEIPFPMGTDGMVLWGEEIVGYTPLNLAAPTSPATDQSSAGCPRRQACGRWSACSRTGCETSSATGPAASQR